MKYKYTGQDKEITIRGVTFKKNVGVSVSGPLEAKISILPYFQTMDRKPKNADQS